MLAEKAYYECTKCHKFYSDETGSVEITDLVIPALGHNFKDYQFDEGSASCTKDGTETAKCERCDKTDTRTAERTKLPHQMSEWVIVSPTCTEEGSRSRSCENCGYTEREKIDALGHSWGEWERDKEPTCTEEGSESHTCSVCKETESRAVQATGHKWSAVMKWAKDYSSAEVTAICGNDPSHVEETKEVTITVKDTSTCVKAGEITYTGTATLSDGSVFADTKTVKGKALGHSFTRYILNSDGSETAKCDRCDVTDTRKSEIKITDRTDNVKVDIGGLDLNQLVKDLAQHDVEIILHQEPATKKDETALKEKVDERYESVGVFDIRLLLCIDGGKSTELTENFGSIQLILPAGKTNAGKKVIVYQMHGNEIITHEGLKVDTDGNVVLKIDKLSSFLVAVEKEAEQPSSDNKVKQPSSDSKTESKTTSVSPETSGETHLILWMTVCMAGVVVCTALAGLKRKQK